MLWTVDVDGAPNQVLLEHEKINKQRFENKHS